jgi:hypothetical protein
MMRPIQAFPALSRVRERPQIFLKVKTSVNVRGGYS